MLEANRSYWDTARSPRVRRVVFDNTIGQQEAVELVKRGDRRVDLVTGVSPLETLRVAESQFARVVKARGTLRTVFGQFNMLKRQSPWVDVRLRKAVNLAINRTDLVQYAARGNGVVIPAMVPAEGFGYPADLAPYPFDPAKARASSARPSIPRGWR